MVIRRKKLRAKKRRSPVSEVFNVLLAEGLIAVIKPCARCGARADWRRVRPGIDVLRPKTNNV